MAETIGRTLLTRTTVPWMAQNLPTDEAINLLYLVKGQGTEWLLLHIQRGQGALQVQLPAGSPETKVASARVPLAGRKP